MDDTDFDLLCKGLSANEARLFRKILKDWCNGDEESFPVQLALLTRAQWRAAATIPRTVDNSGKLIGKHLAECRQHATAIVKNLSTVTDNSVAELKSIVKMQTESANQTSVSFREQLWEVEQTAGQIKSDLNEGIVEWRKARDDFAKERENLDKERKELAARIQWRDWFWAGLTLLGMIAVGMLIEALFHNQYR